MFNPANEISSIDFGAIIGGSLNAVVKAQSDSAMTTVNFVRQIGFMPGEVDADTGEVRGVGAPVCVKFSYDKEVSPNQTKKTRVVSAVVSDAGKEFQAGGSFVVTIDGNLVTGTKVELDGEKIKGVTFSTVPSGDFIKDGADVEITQKKSDGKEARGVCKLSIKENEEVLPALYQKMEIAVPILTMLPIPFIKIAHADIDFNVKINSVSNTASNENSSTNVQSQSHVGYRGWGVNAGTSLNASFSNQKSTSSSEEVKKDYSLNISIHAVQDDMPAGMSRILDILEDSIVTKAITAPVEKNEAAAAA